MNHNQLLKKRRIIYPRQILTKVPYDFFLSTQERMVHVLTEKEEYVTKKLKQQIYRLSEHTNKERAHKTEPNLPCACRGRKCTTLPKDIVGVLKTTYFTQPNKPCLYSLLIQTRFLKSKSQYKDYRVNKVNRTIK